MREEDMHALSVVILIFSVVILFSSAAYHLRIADKLNQSESAYDRDMMYIANKQAEIDSLIYENHELMKEIQHLESIRPAIVFIGTDNETKTRTDAR